MNIRTLLTDAELWNAFRQGDQDAFVCMFQKFSPALYTYGFHLCRSRVQTEDCIQDLFVHLHQHRSTLGETNSIKFYLYRSLRRRIAEKAQAINHLCFQDQLSALPEFEMDMSADAALIDEETAQEQKHKITYLLNQLPRRGKEALYLMYFDELSYPEVAQVMGLEIKSVYNLVYNALVALRGHVEQANIQLFALLLCAVFS